MTYILTTRRPLETAHALRERGWQAYAPAKVSRRHLKRGRTVDVTEALWPGYAFVACEPGDFAAVLAACEHIHDFLRIMVGSERVPCPLQPNALTPIILAEIGGRFDYRPKPKPTPQKGDMVRPINPKKVGHFLGRIVSIARNTAWIEAGNATIKVSIGELEAA